MHPDRAVKADEQIAALRAIFASRITRRGGGRPAAHRLRAPPRRLAAAFATVLGLDPDEITRDDSLFERGGTSLLAVKLVIALNHAATLKDVVRNRVLSDLAALLDGIPTR